MNKVIVVTDKSHLIVRIMPVGYVHPAVCVANHIVDVGTMVAP